MKATQTIFCCLLLAGAADAGLSFKDLGKFYEVNCDSKPAVEIQIDKANGNLRSIRVNGTQLQTNSRGSHINSGFGGKADVSAKPIGTDRLLVTVAIPGLVHYYAFKQGEPAVFMATWAADCPPPGEMRFIARLDSKVLNRGNVERPGDDTSAEAIESKDIFIQPDGRTTSKYYSGVKFIDDQIHGSRGDKVGAFFAIGSHESCSGGPFFRDINSQTAGATEEIYFYMYSGHAQTEPFRKGQLHGPYALCFTEGPPPAMPAMGWMRDLDLKGWVASRGRVAGKVGGMMKDASYTAYLSNSAAQYWTRVAADGSFTTNAMKPGKYTLRLMRGELAVDEKTVEVGSGTVSAELKDPGLPAYLWRLGLPDGTPAGFLNADKIGDMHPSDKRLKPWGPATFKADSPTPSDIGKFPAIQWGDVNDGNRIVFNLDKSQVKDHDLEIGVTVSQYGARPAVDVNGKWSSKPPAAPQTYDSRSITFGIYRGFDKVHTIRIPRTALKAGENTITIHTISGSGSKGFLSNGMVFDYIGLRD